MSSYPRTFPNVRPGAGAVFGSLGAYLSCVDDSSLDLTGAITVDVEVCPTSFVEWDTLATKGTSSMWDDNNYTLGLNVGKPHLRLGLVGQLEAPVHLPLGVSSRLAFVARVGAANALQIFVDGVLVVQGDRTGDPTQNASELWIGTDSGYIDTYNGMMRHAYIYDTVPSATDIADIHHGRVDPLQAWPDNVMLALDLTQPPQTGGAYPVWPDLSGHNNNAVAHGGVGYQRSIPRRVVA